MGVSLAAKNFHMNFFKMLISFGLIQQIGIIYIKKFRLEDLQMQIEPAYSK